MKFEVGDRVRVSGVGHLNGRIGTVLGTDGFDKVRIKCNVKLPEVSADWEHDYWAVEDDHLELVDAITELGEIEVSAIDQLGGLV